jgi:hypothetical protein
MTKQFFITFFLFLSGLLSSCTETIEPKFSQSQSPPIVRYPLHIGFHHGDKYSEHHPNFHAGHIEYVYILAKPSTLFLESNLKAMFEKVEVLKDFSQALPETFDGIITAEIDSFTSPFDDPYKPPSHADIVYIFSLYDNKNKLIDTLKVTGRGHSNIRFGLSPRFQDAVELAIKDAMAQLLVGFEKHPPFKRWLKEHSAIQNEKTGNASEQ